MSGFDAFRALSFDCYGTLIDWETGIADTLEQWAAVRDVPAARVELLEHFAAVESTVQSEQPATLYPRILEEVMRRIGRRLGAPVSADEAHRFGRSVAGWPAFSDSPQALRRLADRFKLIILSNVDRESFLASSQRLGVRFDLVVTAEDVGAYKPSPRSFPAMLDRLGEIGIERHEVLHVAQSLYHDHEPAAAVGVPSVWIDRRHDQGGYGATPRPGGPFVGRWRYPSMEAFADAALGAQ